MACTQQWDSVIPYSCAVSKLVASEHKSSFMSEQSIEIPTALHVPSCRPTKENIYVIHGMHGRVASQHYLGSLKHNLGILRMSLPISNVVGMSFTR